jgi:hypothetical protein
VLGSKPAAGRSSSKSTRVDEDATEQTRFVLGAAFRFVAVLVLADAFFLLAAGFLGLVAGMALPSG